LRTIPIRLGTWTLEDEWVFEEAGGKSHWFIEVILPHNNILVPFMALNIIRRY
ncbi:MAG: hypothetical protein HRT72_05850, partial [Flavobacteriales bacterium]|nr:hypothetical protein [Flavobacteriales bacterium]